MGIDIVDELGYVGKVNLIEELVEEWESGKISDKAAMIALSLIVKEHRRPTQAEIEYGRELAKEFGNNKTNAISPDAGMPQRGVK